MRFRKGPLIRVLVTAAAMVAVSILQWRYALPMGKVGVLELGPAVGLGALVGLGLQFGLLTLVLGMLGMLICGTGDWVNYGAMLVAALVPLVRMSWRRPPVEWPKNQFLLVGLATGLLYYAATLGLTVLRGALVGHSGPAALAFGRQALAPGLLGGLLIGCVIAVVAMVLQVGRPAGGPPDAGSDPDQHPEGRKSVIIDLHNPQKKDRDRHDDDDHQDKHD